jgi:hypothetical protein
MNFIQLDVFKHATFSFCNNILVLYNIILNDKKINKINKKLINKSLLLWEPFGLYVYENTTAHDKVNQNNRTS